ncbi:MAG TPA: hypothetical protein VGG99_27860 [Acetobacteraceae bacterium]|jgi:hypothetical protein
MGDPNTAPAEAYAPDPGRADPDSPDLMPEWLAYLIAFVILFIIEQFRDMLPRRDRQAASCPAGRPASPRDSAQAPTAAIRSQPDPVIARTRHRHADAPECADLSHTRAALLEKLRQSDIDPAILSRLEALGAEPTPIGPDTAAAATEPVSAPSCVAKIRGAPRRLTPAEPQHRVLPTPRRQMFVRPGTGPPTGPRAVARGQSCFA